AYALDTPGGELKPVVALVVLHGIDGTGPSMAAPLLACARARGWTVVAPTIAYGDWRDPIQLADEDLRLAPQLTSMLDAVSTETGEQLAPQVVVFGFSRGAQEALRFSMFYPERVQAVAAFSAGTYTVPVNTV